MTGRIVRVELILAATLAASGWGCRSSWGSSRITSDDGVHERAAQATSPSRPSSGNTGTRSYPARDAIAVVDLAFDILRVDMPVQSIRHSRKIWNHVDETHGDAGARANLARNGIRAGVVSAERWPAIRTILAAGDAELRQGRSLGQRGLPLVIEVGAVDEQTGESIFSYAADHRLAGKTFPRGKKLMTLDYLYHPERGGGVELQLSFEVRHDRGMMTLERVEGIIQQAQDFDRHVFADLNGSLPVAIGGMLAVGPGEVAENPYLVGGRFLSSERGGVRYETLYFITPLAYEARRTSREPPSALSR